MEEKISRFREKRHSQTNDEGKNEKKLKKEKLHNKNQSKRRGNTTKGKRMKLNPRKTPEWVNITS